MSQQSWSQTTRTRPWSCVAFHSGTNNLHVHICMDTDQWSKCSSSAV